MTDPNVSELGKAIQEVTEKLQLLVREEIALAQAEMTQKISKLIRGIVAGAVAGVFALFGLIYLLHAASWGLWELTGVGDGPWFGFLIITLLLFLFGAIGGLLAFRFIKKATPPTPVMAIEEAQLIRETVSGSQRPGTSVPEKVR
ncbi:MAG: phage holin family protein [Actinomycetota bacterium]|nr:phage holin family protein [Actinomycetota bacterium]